MLDYIGNIVSEIPARGDNGLAMKPFHVGLVIKQLRKEAGLRLEDFRPLGGPNKGTMSKIENGVVKANTRTLERIAVILKITYDDLMQRKRDWVTPARAPSDVEREESAESSTRDLSRHTGRDKYSNGTTGNHLGPESSHDAPDARVQKLEARIAQLEAQVGRLAAQLADAEVLLLAKRDIIAELRLDGAELRKQLRKKSAPPRKAGNS